MEILKKLCEYYPAAVFTGKCLVFISEDWRVELTERKNEDFSQTAEAQAVVRVKIFKKAMNGQFVAGHYEDFLVHNLNESAEQIEKYIQSAVGANVRENIE